MDGYGTDQGFQDWLTAQGLDLPSGANVAALRLLGSEYLDAAYSMRLQCSQKTGGFDQEREFPRTGHYVNNQLIPDDAIPKQWVYASYRAAYLNAVNQGWSTNPSDPSRITKREKADVLEREFFAPNETDGLDSAYGIKGDAMINAMVGPILCPDVRDLNNLFMVV